MHPNDGSADVCVAVAQSPGRQRVASADGQVAVAASPGRLRVGGLSILVALAFLTPPSTSPGGPVLIGERVRQQRALQGQRLRHWPGQRS